VTQPGGAEGVALPVGLAATSIFPTVQDLCGAGAGAGWEEG
jgi:hypothetical protein